jgi:hypothetical protein
MEESWPVFLRARSALGEKIFNQRTVRNFSGLKTDLHRIEAPRDLVTIQQLQITLGRATEGFFLTGVDGFGGTAKGFSAASSDFHEGENVTVAADQIDLAVHHLIIPRQDLVAVAAKKRGRHALTIFPDLRRCRQRRRRNALVSA